MEVCGSVGWGVDIVVDDGVGSADGITFGIDDFYDMGSSGGLFDGFNVEKPVVSFMDESL